jgi:hypothetical protein
MVDRKTSRHPVALALSSALIAAALALPLAFTANPGVAEAAARYQPDGRVRQPCHVELPDCLPEWFGNDIYNTTASGQLAEWYDCCGFEDGPVVFRIKVQNDGTRTDRFTLAAKGKTQGYTVKFKRGTKDITAAVQAGTYRTPWLKPGETFLIKARVVKAGACCGDRTARLATITSVSNPNKQDAIRFVRQNADCGSC